MLKRLIATLLYILLWVPVGLLSMLATDWLRKRAPEKSNWQPRPARVNQPESLRKPF